MKLINKKTGEIFSEQVNTAENFISRLIGLMGKKKMPVGSALILKPCNQVHTFFMRFKIDVIFLDRQWVVKHLIVNMAPWRISILVTGARMVVELPRGTLLNKVTPGDKLILEE